MAAVRRGERSHVYGAQASRTGSIRVSDEYRDVYERLLVASWEKPVEFKQHHGDGESVTTVNPAYIVYLRRAKNALLYTRSTASWTPAACAQCAQQ